MKNRKYLIVAFVSLILSFAIAPLRAISPFETFPLYIGTFIRGIIFWSLTVYFLIKYGNTIKRYKIVLLVLLADLLPDIIVRFFMGHFFESLPSFPDTILQIIVVLSGWWFTWCNKKGRVALAIVNLLVCLGVASYGFVLWNELSFVKNSTFDKLEIVELIKQTESPLLQDSITRYCQNKNLIVYIGGEDDDKNAIGFSFLQKVQGIFKGNDNVAVLSIINLNKLKHQVWTQKAMCLEELKYLVICIDESKSQLPKSALYQWYVVDRNNKIRFREKTHFPENEDGQKPSDKLQFFKELIGWLQKE